MNASCAICSDLFDETNQIASAPCGHVYHANCLITWVSQSRTCPQCRSRTFLKGIQKLYFNFVSKPEENSSALENEVASLTTELSIKDEELRSCKQERDDTIAYVYHAEKSANELLKTISRLQHEISEMRSRVSSLSTLEEEIFELQQMNAALVNDLKQYRNIHVIVSGTQKDAEDILKEHNHSAAAKQLATYCACLKRELLEAIHSKAKLTELNSKVKCESNKYAEAVKFYEDAFGIPKNKFQEQRMKVNNPVSIFKSNEIFAEFPSTSSQGISDAIYLSPVSVKINESKLDMRFGSPKNVCNSLSSNRNTMASVSIGNKADDHSFISIECKGFGGGNFTTSSGFREIKIAKKT